MRKIITLLGIVLSTLTFGQNCDEIKNENEYLKKIININQPQAEVTFDKTNIKIVKISGDIKQQKVTISILLNNQDVNKYTKIQYLSAIDLEGNEYFKESYIDIKGLNSLSSTTLNTDVPKKIETVLVKIPSSIKYFKLFQFDYYSDVLKSHKSIEFRDLKIDWK